MQDRKSQQCISFKRAENLDKIGKEFLMVHIIYHMPKKFFSKNVQKLIIFKLEYLENGKHSLTKKDCVS